MANPNNFPNIEGSELVSQSWTKLLERDASVKKQFAASEFPEVTADDVGTPCYREDEQKWYIFTGMGELDTPIWWCPFDEIAAESVAFEPTEEFPASADTVAEALDFLSKKELPNAIIMPAESSEFVGDNVRAEFPLQKVTSNKNTIHVFFSGIKQSPSSYELGEGGASVIFNDPPTYGETILIQENATILEYDLMPLEASFVAENETTFKMPVDVVDVRTIQVNVTGTVLQHNQYKVEGRNVILNEPVTGNVQITTIYKGQLSSPAPNTVNTVALQEGVVTSDKIAEGGVVGANLANASVGATKIADKAVVESKLDDRAVTSVKIAEKTITAENLSEIVEGRLLGASRIESEMLKDNVVNMSKLGEDVLSRINEISTNVVDATVDMKGVVQLASTEEVLEGEGDNKVITSEVLRDTLDTIQALGGSRNIGDIFYTSRLERYVNGSVPCDGSSYDIKDYEGEASVGNLFKKGYLPYISMSEYDNLINEKGSCRCFGWDGGDIFRVPTLSEVYIEAGFAAGAGEFISESLPNIRGFLYQTGADDGPITQPSAAEGAFTVESNGGNGAVGSGTASYNLRFNASLSSPVYQDGAKVKPDSVKYRAMVQLHTGSKEVSIQDYTRQLQESTDNHISHINEVADERLIEVNNLADDRVVEVNEVSDNRIQEIIAMGSTNIVYWD